MARFRQEGRVLKCREFSTYTDANGNTVEVWGESLPLTACHGNNGAVRPFSRFEVRGTEATTETAPPAPTPESTEKKEIPTWLLILAAAVIAYFVFKK